MGVSLLRTPESLLTGRTILIEFSIHSDFYSPSIYTEGFVVFFISFAHSYVGWYLRYVPGTYDKDLFMNTFCFQMGNTTSVCL